MSTNEEPCKVEALFNLVIAVTARFTINIHDTRFITDVLTSEYYNISASKLYIIVT